MQFDDVKFEMIGRGGTSEDRPLVEHIEEALQRLAQLVREPDRDRKATITVKLVIRAEGDTGVVIAPSVTVQEPARAIRALSAVVTEDGQVLTMQHRQQALPLATVAPMRREKGGE